MNRGKVRFQFSRFKTQNSGFNGEISLYISKDNRNEVMDIEESKKQELFIMIYFHIKDLPCTFSSMQQKDWLSMSYERYLDVQIL